MAQIFEDSHFKWTDQYRGDTSLRDCDELIGKIDDCLRDNPGYMEIEAVLFKAFLYLAHWRKLRNRKSKEAKKCLDIAFNTIKNCQNDDARNGYSIVGYTLYWQIERIQKIDSSANEYGKCISAINKTPKCNAFIDATRAFALSFLGPEREEESLRYYSQALSMYPNNINWMFGFAHRLGKKARRLRDEQASEEERHIYEKILEKDPKHIRAMLFIAQNKFHKHDKGDDKHVIKLMFNEVLALAKQDGHCHPKVAVRVARFFRLTYKYKQALEILSEAEYSIGKDPNEMLFHQKAMVYLTKYKKYDDLRGFAKEFLLVGEKKGERKSLLQESLNHLDEAVTRCAYDSGGRYRLDRAYVYEQLDMYDEADDEYTSLMDASQGFHNQGRFSLYLKYGLYLKRRGNVELMMNYLSKGIELFKSQIYGTYTNSIDGDIYLALSFYDNTNASKCSLNTSTVRAEALYRLGWLRLLFSDVMDVTLKNVLSKKNNRTNKTHLQLYEQAYEEIVNKTHENRTPGLLSDIINGLITCHLQEGQTENLSKAVSLIMKKLPYYKMNGASESLADVKLAQCEQSSENERPRLLSETVQKGSLDACERLCEWFEGKSCPSSDPDVLRYCVQIQNCLSRDKLMYRQYNFLGGLFLHTFTDTADLNDSEIDRKTTVLSSIRSILKRKDDDLDELRELYLRLLESREAKEDDAVVITHSSQVICNARYALAHAIVSFQRRFFSWHGWYTPPKRGKKTKKEEQEFPIVKAAPNINVRNELNARLQTPGQKYWPMPEFSRQYTDLLEYLTSIQPAVYQDGSYDWLAALHDVTIIRKHREPLSQMEYTVSVGKDCNYREKTRTFNTVDLAQTARFGVEKIVMELRNIGRKFDMLDRKTLRFAELKNLRVNRYREMERSSV